MIGKDAGIRATERPRSGPVCNVSRRMEPTERDPRPARAEVSRSSGWLPEPPRGVSAQDGGSRAGHTRTLAFKPRRVADHGLPREGRCQSADANLSNLLDRSPAITPRFTRLGDGSGARSREHPLVKRTRAIQTVEKGLRDAT